MNVPRQEEPVTFTANKCFTCTTKEEDRRLADEAWKNHINDKKKKILDTFQNKSLMNKKLLNASFEEYKPSNIEQENALRLSKRYADNFDLNNPVNLLFEGSYGVGKSHLSAAITKDLMKKNMSCIFISTPKLLTKIKSTYNKESEHTEEELIDLLSEVDCLVLDDIGAESTNKKKGEDNQHTWATSKLFEIIDNRIGRHTIYTTNFPLPELKQRLGGRNYSRMMEDTHLIKVVGEDYRVKDFQ